VFSNRFSEHSLAHFSDVQRISGNYSSVIAIIVARKFMENQPTGVLRAIIVEVNPTFLGSETCYLPTGVLRVIFDPF
jgi:hypothetical protein